MTISLIACITKYNNKLAIGIDNTLLFKLKRDIDFFKNITTNSLSIYKDSTLQNKKNIVCYCFHHICFSTEIVFSFLL